MSKIKINLVSGSVVEKPLVTCFKGTNGSYLVLDNETNGSMGYPIICISKINGTNVEKIFDQGEWASVKDNLKTIIAGTSMPYLAVPEVLNAQDDFFTQLTLPVASFDLLKNVYKAPVSETIVAQDPIMPAADVLPMDMMPPAAPVASASVNPIMPEPSALAAAEIAPIAPVVEPVIPTAETPSVAPAIEMPVIDMPVSAPAPEIAPMPVAPAPVGDDIAMIKENFMKSCENMFDALIKKFENK